ncbi:MAG: LTA synthase family protein [Ignavibacteriae bacterium]|nr:LTA synthase family protein [Ignavibacteriota bacterium]
MPRNSLFTMIFYRLIHLCFILIVLSFSQLLNKRVQIAFLVGMNVLVSIIMVGDIWYYRAFANFLSFYSLLQIGNLENLWSSIIAMIHVIDVLFVIDLPIFFLLHFVKNQNLSIIKRSNGWFASTFAIPLVLLWIANIMFEKKTTNFLFTMAWIPNQTLFYLAPVGYHIVDVYEYFKFGKIVLSEEQEKLIHSWWDTKEQPINGEYFSIFKQKNLIFIQVESLESFVIGQSYQGQEITPVLNRLLEHSFYFTNFYDDINNGGSADADLLVHTSLYPPRKGSSFLSFPTNKYNSLPKILGRAGYSSIVLKSDKGNYYNWKPALTSMGFDKCYDAEKYKRDELFGMGLSDSSYLHQTVAYITQQQKPFYSFTVTVTSHSPFNLPQNKRELQLPEYLDKSYLGGYLQSIHYTDKFIGQFLSRLDIAGVLDSSVIVIYGDHSGIHRYFSDEVTALKPSIPWTLDNTGRIPLFIYKKEIRGKKIPVYGSQIDIMPTILPLFGVPSSEYVTTSMGRDLLTTKRNFTLRVNGSCIGENYSEFDKEKAIQTLAISDLIIRSNYFGTHQQFLKK